MNRTTRINKSLLYFAKIFCFFLFIVYSNYVNAQVSYLEFSHSQKTFTPLVNATVVATATGNSGSASLDDNVYTVPENSIPFNFNFDNNVYTGLKISTNGYITFGTVTDIVNKAISSTKAFKGVVAAASVDLNGLFQIENKTAQISYKVIGQAPNRTFVVEYLHFRPYSASANTENYYDWNFQIHLNEDHSIEIVYDLLVKGTPSSAIVEVGIRGADNANFNSRKANGTASSNWLSSIASTSNSDGITVNTTTLPPSGYAYKWTKTNFCLPKYEYTAIYDTDPITRVIFNTIDKTSPSTVGSTPSYENFKNESTDVNKGSSYEISIKGPSSTFASDVMVYIDFNQNGLFDDPGEAFYIGRLQAQNPFNALTITSNITIPANALTGSTTMRIVKNTNVPSFNNPDAPNSISGPCAQNLRTGQVEEYTLNILQDSVNPPTVQSVNISTLNNAPAQITSLNGTLQLIATVNPSTVSQEVTWTVTSGSTNATINTTGLVTGIANGTVTIRATSNADVSKFAEKTVTINIPTVQSVNISTLNNVPAQITSLNETLQLIATVNPSTVSQEVTWTVTSGSTNATINATGLVTGIANGTVTIRATSNADVSKFAEINILVDLATASNERFNKEHVRMYPNPTAGSIILETENGTEISNISLYDITGKKVAQYTTASFDISHLNVGVYLTKIEFANGNQSFVKIIKK